MHITPFKLEEFWKKFEFSIPYLLCQSDAEHWSLEEILEMAEPEMKRLWETLQLSYTESPGHPLLREEIAKLYSSVSSNQVLTFAGGEEGIYCSLRSLLSKGDHVIVITPCYQSLETIPRACGAEVTTIELDPNNQWNLTLEQLERTFRPTTKAIILNNPHNPTGALLQKSVYEGMIELARKRGTYIFIDEVYRYLEEDKAERLPSIVDAYEKGIALNIMTKSFGLGGLRIGWVASREPEFLKNAGSYKLYLSICNSAPSEILAMIGLRAKENILERNRAIVLSNLALLDAFMERQRSRLSWVRPRGGIAVKLKLCNNLIISVINFIQYLFRCQFFWTCFLM